MISKFYKDRRGVTLVEIIVVLAILGIVLGSAYSMLSFGNKTFTGGNKQYNSQSSARLSADYIIQEIRYATSLAILSDPPVTNVMPYSYLYIKDGSLYHDIYDPTTPSYETRVFKGVLLEVQPPFVNIDDSILGITIESKDGNQDYSLATEIDLPNFNLLSKSILGTSGKAIIYSTDSSVPVPAPGPGPGPAPAPTDVTVTFTVDKNHCSVLLNGVSVPASGNPARNFVFNNVPINTTVQYTIIHSGVTVKDNENLVVGEDDMTVFTAIP